MPDSIRMIAVDLDQTLITSERTVCAESFQALQDAVASGIHVVVATARQWSSTQAIAAALGNDQPVICNNGADIMANATGEVWQAHRMPIELGVEVAALARANGWFLSFTVAGETHAHRDGQWLSEAEVAHPDFHGWLENDAGEGPVRILAFEEDAVRTYRELVESQHRETSRIQDFHNEDGALLAIGLLPLAATKGRGINDVAARLGLQASQVMALGDNDSDISMFREAGVSVAMANGTPEAREAADHVAPSNDEAGVAWAVREFALKG